MAVTPNPQISAVRPGKPTQLSVNYGGTNGEWVAAPGEGRQQCGEACAASSRV
jgi:hypothetical protein